MTWAARHLIDVENLSSEDVEAALALATDFRAMLDDGLEPPPGLTGQHVAMLFAEASTRTRLSFELAARRLGADTYLLYPGSSSLTKGESLVDTVRNLDAIGFDYLIVRHHRAGSASVAARYFGGHVVNAGDGWHAHPTQALLDLFTLARAWDGPAAGTIESLRGRKVAIVGDVMHSRVARSNAFTLCLAGADVWLSAPRGWLRGVDGLPLTLTDDLSAALRGADAVMALRVQKERMAGRLSLDEYVSRYQITERRLARLAPEALFLHPGPINEGIEVSRDVALGTRSLVLEQARNGVPVRMAVLSLLAGARRDAARDQATDATRALSSAMR